MKKTFLGGLSPQQFLRRHWQKQPLLIKNAFPGFKDLLTREQLFELACRDDVQARQVMQKRNTWEVFHGPFAAKDFRKLPKCNWTLLVQGVNHFLPQAQRLLLQFNFIPYARLDDLMVSYAPPGGGVGPHFDSYDVFLLQGGGRRLWQISAQKDLQLIENAPLKILKKFNAEQEWLVEAGDMLYLPPQYAHNGAALDDCMTYSIGFRAPSAQELAVQFLLYLQDHLHFDGMYCDPGLRPQLRPAQISEAMLRKAAYLLKQIKWSGREVELFFGQYLTEPKPHVIFEPPKRPLAFGDFVRHITSRGAHLDLKSRMLVHRNRVFMNGETYEFKGNGFRSLAALADARELATRAVLDGKVRNLLYQWYAAGYIKIGCTP
ncbi:MAG TPA: cupin domain-containing protein [Burkholderiales bacterium]|nr:cupin domain-containing protein [Burkholderiales bacterium]